MLELLLLDCYKNTLYDNRDIKYDKEKYFTRLQELREEFLRPYVINLTSKE